jgi:hypothetical protein
LTASHTLSEATKSALNIPRRFHVEPVVTPVRFSLEHADHPCEAVQDEMARVENEGGVSSATQSRE